MTKHIPKERLAFYFGTLRKKESTFKTYLVNLMPFDLDEVKGLHGDDVWGRLKDMSVNYLRNTKKLPSFAKEQDYETPGGCGYHPYARLKWVANNLDKPKAVKRKKIKVFNNAFDNIILPNGHREKIIETITQLKDHEKIFKEWGLEEKVKRGKGINLLFSGKSGTGKTYCGEIIAEYLGTEYKVVSVSTIESKWIGESEKNVSAMFKALTGNNTVLIIDEVDSFITSRSRLSHHHYTKLTNQFLVELERHNGICVMTTNRPVVLDKALARRIDLVLDFPFPSEEARERIWKYMIPDKLPKKNIDHRELARVSIHGGGIKNAVMATARKMASDDIKKATTELFKEKALEEQKEMETIGKGDYS